jgi:hypothetical protein
MLRGDFKAGDTIIVDYHEADGIVFVRKQELVVEVPSSVGAGESE